MYDVSALSSGAPIGSWTMRIVLFVAMLLALALPSTDGRADDRMRRDHDRARAAFQRGEIRPLDDILARLRPDFPGRLLRVDLNLENAGSQRWVYQILVIGREGKVTRLRVDARTADIIAAEAGPLPRAPRPPLAPSPNGGRPGDLPATRPAAVR